MKEQLKLKDCPKFTLLLRSHTLKNRLIEAKKQLLNVYPYEVSEHNLLIVKTDSRGKYDVYISKEEIKYDKDIKKTGLIVISYIIAAFVFALFFHNVAVRNRKEMINQKELEKQKLEQERLVKEKEVKLEKVKKEYIELKESEYEKIYPYIERIYSAMTDKTTVENISIDRNIFTVEVTAKDSIAVLSNFEQNSAFSSIKMNRTNVKDGKETVTYTGEFSRYIKESDDDKTLDEKIDFYTKQISISNERKQKQREIQLSEYIKQVREILHKNDCHEQYIQLRGKEKHAEVEFFILSTSRNMLNFIKEIQLEDTNLKDIKSFHLNNSVLRNNVQTTVCFDTGIEFKQDNEQLSELADIKISTSDIDRIFYKASSPKTTVKNYPVTAVRPQRTVKAQAPIKNKKLTYVGLTKSNGQSIVLVKDEEMGSIYKLLLSDVEINGDCCIVTQSGYKAKIRGDYYEVKK